MSEQKLPITELERQLEGDQSGVAVKTLVEQLAAGKRRAQRSLDQGVGRDEQVRLTALIAAYDAGIEALPQVWSAINSQP